MSRLRTRYETVFALTALFLAVGALFAFSQLRLRTPSRQEPPAWQSATGAIEKTRDEGTLVGGRAIAATEADYRRFAADDAEWRRRNAQLPDLFVLKRRAMEERVFRLSRSGQRGGAIAELERWTAQHPRDRQAVLWLARLLRDAGRTNESLAKYREILSLSQRTP